MKIEWAALGLVSVVSLFATVVVVAITAAGVNAFDTAHERAKVGESDTSQRILGYACVTAAAAAVLFGIYLIVPVFH